MTAATDCKPVRRALNIAIDRAADYVALSHVCADVDAAYRRGELTDPTVELLAGLICAKGREVPRRDWTANSSAPR